VGEKTHEHLNKLNGYNKCIKDGVSVIISLHHSGFAFKGQNNSNNKQ